MPFQFNPLDLPGVLLVEAKSFEDPRGYFMETYKRSAFQSGGIPSEFVQDNLSQSMRGVLRGLHYQKSPMAQGKLLSVLSGAIFDVAVDIRQGSPTFGEWIGVRLAAEEHRLLYVPEGFAHGFQALEDGTLVWYKVTSEYAPELDRGIAWNDPRLAIDWPLENPILSEKDSDLPDLATADNDFLYEREDE